MTSAEKIAFMHHYFGEDDAGRRCRDCIYFERWLVGDTKIVRKCRVYGISHSEATDWKASFPACGCINKDTDYSNLYKTITTSKYKVELQGQLELTF